MKERSPHQPQQPGRLPFNSSSSSSERAPSRPWEPVFPEKPSSRSSSRPWEPVFPEKPSSRSSSRRQRSFPNKTNAQSGTPTEQQTPPEYVPAPFASLAILFDPQVRAEHEAYFSGKPISEPQGDSENAQPEVLSLPRQAPAATKPIAETSEDSQLKQSEGNGTVEYATDPQTGQRYIIEYRVVPGSQSGTFVFIHAYGQNRNRVYQNETYRLEDEFLIRSERAIRHVKRASGAIEEYQIGDKFQVNIGDELLSPVREPPSQESQSNWWLPEHLQWVWGVLQGDFNEDPSLSQIVVRTLITLIPGADQIADVQDLVAALYKLAWQKRYNEGGPWFDLFITGIGLVPTLGSALKGIVQLLKRGANTVDLGTFRRILDASGLNLEELVRNFSRYNDEAAELTQRIVENLASKATELANTLRPHLLLDPTNQLKPFIARLEELSRSLEEVHGLIRDKFREVAEEIQQVLDEIARRLGIEDELATANGAPMRSQGDGTQSQGGGSGSGGVDDDDLWAQVERDFNPVEIRPEARNIANGHAFRDHRVEFERIGIRTPEELAEHISNIMNNPSDFKRLQDGRSAYWDDATGTVVIYNPRLDQVENGTAFIPDEGRYYFDVRLN
jgi:hypothetical protein